MTDKKMLRHTTLYKKVGETPLKAIELWKEAHREYADTTACYAGRLDPMAEGKLLILFGDECKRLTRYTGLDKEYEIEVVLDVHTDTGDVLGLPVYDGVDTRVEEAALARILRAEVGAHERAYPAYSSKTVNGKPLFLHTLQGTLSREDIPTHIENVYRVVSRGVSYLDTHTLRLRVMDMLALAPRTDDPRKQEGKDFRQDEIRAVWEAHFETNQERTYAVISLRVVCASGTYMRSLAERMGASLGTTALALSIKRTKIGNYWHGFWLKQF